MIELMEIMRQKNDKAFTELLNRIRTASHTEDDIKVIQSRSITPSDPLHIWAENAPFNEHNESKGKDQYPRNVNKISIEF